MTDGIGANVELIEFTDHPEDVKIVSPNAIIINGQQTLLSVDTPVTVEYAPRDEQPEYAVVTVRMQVRRLLIEARRETDITNIRFGNNGSFLTRLLDKIDEATERRAEYSKAAILSNREIGTLSSDWNSVTVADELGVAHWVPVKPFGNETVGRNSVAIQDVVEQAETETAEQRWARLDREYFDLVGKAVRIVEGSEPLGAVGKIHEYIPANGLYRARFEVHFTDPQSDYLGHRTYIREAFEVLDV
jgi:hypothetical protein